MEAQHIEQVVQKLEALAPNRIDEVEDFIDFLSQRDTDTRCSSFLTEKAIKEGWEVCQITKLRISTRLNPFTFC